MYLAASEPAPGARRPAFQRIVGEELEMGLEDHGIHRPGHLGAGAGGGLGRQRGRERAGDEREQERTDGDGESHRSKG